jgi:acid stress-induced BolA-like protein IbaG/YrbA
MNVELIKNQLKNMPNLQVLEVDGDGMHFQIRLVTTDFEGKNKLARHRMVYKYLQTWLADGTLHAVELDTLTPSEWEAMKHE